MIIFNTTFSVPEELQNEFLDFIREEYIPLAAKNQKIKEPRLARVFSRNNDSDLSFALEFKADSVEDLEAWNKTEGDKLHSLITTKFRQNIVGFATILQSIDL